MEDINTSIKSIQDLQDEIVSMQKQIVELRKQLSPEEIKDYTLKDRTGKNVSLYSLFGDNDELLVIHNMGKRCAYCTMWADGFNGLWRHINNRMPFVLVSPDPPEVMNEFASGRNWEFPVFSAHDSNFIEDLGFKSEKGYMPGASALIKENGKAYRQGHDYFGPGDFYNSAWHLFDLFPKGYNKWQPKYTYR